jgi:hypothetical protein
MLDDRRRPILSLARLEHDALVLCAVGGEETSSDDMLYPCVADAGSPA